MTTSPYLILTTYVLSFAAWSSFWPRNAVKSRIEPMLGFRAYRIIYNVGTILLFGLSFAYLTQHSSETVRFWSLKRFQWFKPLIYATQGLGVFFLSASTQLGLSFWGLTNPGPDTGLQTNGFYKITRHPLYWSVFFLLFGHLLVFGSGLAVLYFVLMELYNVAGVIVFENRALAKNYGDAFTAFHARTSTLPFKSLLLGKVRWEPGEPPKAALLSSVVFTLVLALLHDPLLASLMHGLPTFVSR
jgi:uncharacterized membrane protein